MAPQAEPVKQPAPQAPRSKPRMVDSETVMVEPQAQKPINVPAYMQAIRELWEDLKGTLSFFSMDSQQFKNVMEDMNTIFKDGKVDADRLDYACDVLAADAQEYLDHTERHPRPGNERREARIGIMQKLKKLGQAYRKKVSDPKESYVESAKACMKEKIIVTTHMDIRTVETAFKQDETFNMKLQSLSIYQLDKITTDEAQMEKMMQDFLAAGNGAKAKANQVEKTVSKNQKTR